MTNETHTAYFHGVPGGAAELSLFGAGLAARVSSFVVAQREFPASPQGTNRFVLIANAIRRDYPDRPIRLVGFSLGAVAALKVAEILGDQAVRLDLISAAAPLDMGDYLPRMAGAPVFRCAQSHPLSFRLLSRSQSLLAKMSPSMLFSALFASAQGADVGLRDDPQFRAMMIFLLRNCLTSSLVAYRSEISSYVGDWSHILSRITQPVSIYHGRLDNWSPIEMATDLAATLSNCQRVEIMEGCSHYSALRTFLQNC